MKLVRNYLVITKSVQGPIGKNAKIIFVQWGHPYSSPSSFPLSDFMETPRKRQRDSSSSSGPSASSSSGRGARRTKNVQACASCRKHKTRCEILDGVNQPIIRCHRCKTLEVECSYEKMDRSTLELSRPAVQESSPPTSVNRVAHERNLELLSGYSGTATPANAPGTSNASLPIDLYPNKPQTIWDFMHLPQGSLDWSAPVEAMQELMKKQSISVASQPSLPISNDSLDNILSPDQILHLSSMYVALYLLHGRALISSQDLSRIICHGSTSYLFAIRTVPF